MCWSSKYYPKIEIVDYPLVVYKVVRYVDLSICYSLCRNFEYIYKEEYKQISDLKITQRKYHYEWVINEGFHSYTRNRAIQEYKETVLHSISKFALVECIIPKGSTFYRNENNEIVSDRIIINKILRTNDLFTQILGMH